MDTKTIKKKLEQRLQADNRSFSFNQEKDELRIVNTTTNKGITVSIPPIIAKWEVQKEKAVDEVVYYVENALNVMGTDQTLNQKDKQIFPVIRATSFPSESSEGIPFLTEDHTAETRIYFALDLGNTYRLIDASLAEKEGWTKEKIKEIALFNVRSLPTSYKKDEVAGNIFYFLNTNDGYDASRVLNESFLKKMSEEIKGDFLIAIPHQDVLILADVRNETGYDVMAQMAMSFFTNGLVPVTALSFIYEDGELDPVFILGKNKTHTKE
jgi:uncharacterized protein YtpQ (UPF0354 family)